MAPTEPELIELKPCGIRFFAWLIYLKTTKYTTNIQNQR